MPELPEVETIVAGLRLKISGRNIIKIESNYKIIIDHDFNYFCGCILNQVIINISRHGKYIFIDLSNEKTVVVHLRMTGQLFLIKEKYFADKHTHLELFLDNGTKIVYRDIRKFGRFIIIDSSGKEKFIERKKLAEDALKIDFEDFSFKLKARKVCLKAVLLDQSAIAGLGNIYADEILFASRLSPYARPGEIDSESMNELFKNIKGILAKAISKEGTTFSDYVTSDGSSGRFQNELKVYGRQGKKCFECNAEIVKERVAGRGTHFCTICQKLFL